MSALSNMLLVPGVIVALASAGHALLYKRDPRAALGWITVCLVFPFVGPLMYFLFGINRIHTRARRLKGAGRYRLDIFLTRHDSL